jgi:ABC-type sugar transport system permease subunit
MGYASALAWVLLIVTLIFTVIIFRSSKRWVFYQGGMFR